MYVFNTESCFPVLLSFPVKDNILIDQTGHARLADFGFLTIISDAATHLPSSSYSIGGTLRWMSPELIAPEEFGMERSRPTKSSDCYSFGMVVYETVSGKKPYHETPDVAVFLKIVKGEWPRRYEGFVDRLWGMMEQCWSFEPNCRPSIEGVLQCLEVCSKSLSGVGRGVGGDLGFNGLYHSRRAEMVRLMKITLRKKIRMSQRAPTHQCVTTVS